MFEKYKKHFLETYKNSGVKYYSFSQHVDIVVR